MNIVVIANELSNAKLVGIGESTHGTHEFFNFKSSVFKELVIAHEYNTLFLEDSSSACETINEYIATGKGNLNDLINGLYSVWRTEELKKLIQWLKDNYASHAVKLTGFDINQADEDMLQRDELMASNIKKRTKLNTKALIWAHNSHLQFYESDINKKPMGMFLKKEFSKDYTAVAQLFGTGSVSATRFNADTSPTKDRTLSVIKVDSISPQLAEMALNDLGVEPYFLSKQQIAKLNGNMFKRVRSIGWGLVPEMVDDMVEETDLVKSFDGVVYFPVATHSHPLS